MSKKIICFLSTRNSCRSQMAEGWAKKYLNEDWDVFSGGIETHIVNPNAVKVMREVGIDISNQKSKIIDPIVLVNADLVVTLSQEAAEICTCSKNLTRSKCVHWGFDDEVEVDDPEMIKNFKRLRDEIGLRIERFAITNGCSY